MISGQIPHKKEYVYSQSATQDAETSKDGSDQYYTIKKYRQNPLEISNLIDAGLISSQQGFWDTATSADMGSSFEVENTIGLVPGFNKNNFKFDNSVEYNGKELNKIQSRKFYAIHSSYPYQDAVSFRELENLNRTLTAKALRKILVTGSVDVVVSGRNFITPESNKSIGTLLKLRFLNSELTEDINSKTDKVKSGKHLIYAVRHNIRKERYDVTLSCVKLENLE
jgi:hypothetical protein